VRPSVAQSRGFGRRGERRNRNSRCRGESAANSGRTIQEPERAAKEFLPLFRHIQRSSGRLGPHAGGCGRHHALRRHAAPHARYVAGREVKDRLEQLAALPDPGGDTASIQAAIAHGGLLHDLLPLTDAALKALMAEATTREQDAVRALIMKRQFAARASARHYRVLLYATSLLLLG